MTEDREVQSLINGLIRHGPISDETTNRLLKLKHVAVPILLGRIRVLDHQEAYKKGNEAEKIGLACAILSTNAHPILNEVVKGLASEDASVRGTSAVILELAGPASFMPVLEFSNSNPLPLQEGLIKKLILPITESSPDLGLRELVRLYRLVETRTGATQCITSAFQEVLIKEDFRSLFPILKSLLMDKDPFLASAALTYIRRCGPVAEPVIGDVNRLLTAGDPQVRSAATNALNAIMKAP